MLINQTQRTHLASGGCPGGLRAVDRERERSLWQQVSEIIKCSPCSSILCLPLHLVHFVEWIFRSPSSHFFLAFSVSGHQETATPQHACQNNQGSNIEKMIVFLYWFQMCVNQKQKVENVKRLDVSFAIYRLATPGDNRIWDFILMK